jgi:chromosomal replication initiation ATPase DnaA
MKNLVQEAEQYAEKSNINLVGKRTKHRDKYTIADFIAGATSKWVQVEKIKVQIDENDSILQMLFLHGNEGSRIRIVERIESLNQQLKDLENENT